jgi:hypothetical protein
MKLFPARESLVSDIPAGDGKIVNLFFTVHQQNETRHRKTHYKVPSQKKPTQKGSSLKVPVTQGPLLRKDPSQHGRKKQSMRIKGC